MLYTRIIQGTTPFLKFLIQVPIEQVNKVRISFIQKKQAILVKEKIDCSLIKEDNSLVVGLTQLDTYKLDENKGNIQVVLRIGYGKSSVYAEEYTIGILNIEDKEVLQ